MKLPIILSSVAVLTLALTGCNKDNLNAEKNELTADEQKTKLVDVATQFVEVFNAEDQKEAVEALDWIVYYYFVGENYYSWDEVGSYYEDVLNIVSATASNARRLSGGQFTANLAAEIYEFPDFTGIFEANDKTMSWEYVGPSENITLRCTDKDGNPAEVVLTASGEEVEFEYEYWDYDSTTGEDFRHPFTAVLPSKISLSLKINGNEYVKYDMDFDVEKSSHIKLNTNVKITDILYDLAVSVEKNSVSVSTNLKYGDKTLLAVTASAPSCVLMDKGDNIDWDKWFELYGDAFEYGTGEIEFGNLIAEANILSQIQIKAESQDPSALYRSMNDLDEEYENRYGYDYYDMRDYNLEVSDLVNKNVSVSVYYSSDVKQAEIRTEVFEDDYYSSYEDSYYYVGPVVYFPKDETSYAFDEYFTERAFGSVIELTETLVNQYIGLLRYNDIEPVEF